MAERESLSYIDRDGMSKIRELEIWATMSMFLCAGTLLLRFTREGLILGETSLSMGLFEVVSVEDVDAQITLKSREANQVAHALQIELLDG